MVRVRCNHGNSICDIAISDFNWGPVNYLASLTRSSRAEVSNFLLLLSMKTLITCSNQCLHWEKHVRCPLWKMVNHKVFSGGIAMSPKRQGAVCLKICFDYLTATKHNLALRWWKKVFVCEQIVSSGSHLMSIAFSKTVGAWTGGFSQSAL